MFYASYSSPLFHVTRRGRERSRWFASLTHPWAGRALQKLSRHHFSTCFQCVCFALPACLLSKRIEKFLSMWKVRVLTFHFESPIFSLSYMQTREMLSKAPLIVFRGQITLRLRLKFFFFFSPRFVSYFSLLSGLVDAWKLCFFWCVVARRSSHIFFRYFFSLADWCVRATMAKTFQFLASGGNSYGTWQSAFDSGRSGSFFFSSTHRLKTQNRTELNMNEIKDAWWCWWGARVATSTFLLLSCLNDRGVGVEISQSLSLIADASFPSQKSRFYHRLRASSSHASFWFFIQLGVRSRFFSPSVSLRCLSMAMRCLKVFPSERNLRRVIQWKFFSGFLCVCWWKLFSLAAIF